MVEIRAPKNHKDCVSGYSSGNIVIYVPPQTSIKLNVGIGDVTINGIRGDKKIDMNIGDLRVGIRDPKEYDHLDISTRIGDIDDSLHHSALQGFTGKFENVVQPGRYHLRAHVGIGDVELTQEDAGT
jgi:hypothetical protein